MAAVLGAMITKLFLFVPKKFKCFCSVVLQEGLLEAIFCIKFGLFFQPSPPSVSAMILCHAEGCTPFCHSV